MTHGEILLLMTALFLIFGYMGVPVVFALMAGVLTACLLTPISMQSMIGQMFHGIDSEILLAVPFFLLVGELMTSANVTNRMIALAQTMVGHMRGGLAQVVTLFSMFFAGISGSSTADVAVLSRTVAPEMDREGYDRAFTAALIACASTMANLIPPSIMAVVYGDRQRLDRRAVSCGRRAWHRCRHRPDDLFAFFRPGGHEEAACVALRICRRGAGLRAADDDSSHHYGRNPDRLVHADRGRDDRVGLYPVGDRAAAQSRPYPPSAARLRLYRAALFPSARAGGGGVRLRLDARLPARPRYRRRLD